MGLAVGWVTENGEKVRSGFRNFYFLNRVVSEMLGAVYGLSKKLCTEFCVIFTKFGIFGLSLDFSEATYDRTYGRKWQIYVKCFCVLLLEI